MTPLDEGVEAVLGTECLGHVGPASGGNRRRDLNVVSLWCREAQGVADGLRRALRARRGGMHHKKEGDPILCGHAAIL